MRRGVALGCGGSVGLVWSAVALQTAERELGWDARTAEVIQGTSAGAELAVMLGSGRGPTDVVDAMSGAVGADPLLVRHLGEHPGPWPGRPRWGRPARGLVSAGVRTRQPYVVAAGLLPPGRLPADWLRRLGHELSDRRRWSPHRGVRVVAVDADSGDRTAFGAPGAPQVPLAEALAASWAVPGWLEPVPLVGRRWVDGGAVSSVSADLLVEDGLDELVVIAPMTSRAGARARGAQRLERVLRRQMTRRLDHEIALVERAGTRVIRIEPDPRDLQAMGANFMDARRRTATLSVARATMAATVDAAVVRSASPAVLP